MRTIPATAVAAAAGITGETLRQLRCECGLSFGKRVAGRWLHDRNEGVAVVLIAQLIQMTVHRCAAVHIVQELFPRLEALVCLVERGADTAPAWFALDLLARPPKAYVTNVPPGPQCIVQIELHSFIRAALDRLDDATRGKTSMVCARRGMPRIEPVLEVA